tara:strand:+ start:3893 stop:4660 length:768 start_codon:yes stop_codon:yes gene_type:complete
MAEEQAPASTEEAPQQTEDVSRETIAERPEHIPEKFWNAETGELRQDDMIKSYNNLEKFATGKKDEMREAVLAELKGEADELAPEKYELPKLVEGITEEMVRENPMTEWWEEKCKEYGLSQDQYEEGVNKWIDIIMNAGPDLDGEMEKLGENARDRLDAVTNYAKSQFPPEEFELIANTLGTSATGISVLERIMDMGRSQMMRSEQVAQPERELTVADVKQMMNDKRYFDSRFRDRDYVKKVDDAWARLNNAGKV